MSHYCTVDDDGYCDECGDAFDLDDLMLDEFELPLQDAEGKTE